MNNYLLFNQVGRIKQTIAKRLVAEEIGMAIGGCLGGALILRFKRLENTSARSSKTFNSRLVCERPQ